MTGFHVTSKVNMLSILTNGFKPKCGPRSKAAGEERKAVYFFTSAEDCENALLNWLGEEDLAEPVVLVAEIPEEVAVESDAEYEVAVLEWLDSAHIVGTITADYFHKAFSVAA